MKMSQKNTCLLWFFKEISLDLEYLGLWLIALPEQTFKSHIKVGVVLVLYVFAQTNLIFIYKLAKYY